MEAPELWLLCGREPVLFRLPYFVTWEGEEAVLTAAIHFRRMEKEAAARILCLHGKPRRDQWVVSQLMLEKVAERTRGGDPEAYYAWNQPRPAPHRMIEGREERSEFTDALYQAGVGDSPEQVAYFWKQFCQHSAHWLMNKEKPVDMIFLRLHNTPYRPNWKIILLQRFRRLGPALAHANTQERDRRLHQSGFYEELLSLDLLAFQTKHQTCYRQVEVEHRKPWWKLVKRTELTRLRQGPYRYADYFLDSMRRFIPTAVRLYTLWLAHLNKPCVADCEGGRDGRIRFVPNVLAGRLHPSSREYHGLPPQVLNKLPRFKAASVPDHLLAADGQLPALSAVQPAVEDLRDAEYTGPGPAVGKPIDGGGGSDGLRVPASVEELASGDVLAARTGVDEPRLAGGA